MNGRIAHTLLILLFACSTAFSTTIATWDAFSANEASGEIDGITILASTTNDAPFLGIVNDRFSDIDKGGWDAPFPLSPDALSLVASEVNGGDVQRFAFGEPIDEGLLYIENFDSNSIATIVAFGADDLQLVASSPSIDFDPLTKNAGRLSTDNPTFNGEGDAIIFFGGGVTGITIDFERGDGANGVFYGFVVEDAQSVPEPSAGSMLAILGLLPLAFRKQRSA